jgi:hypothetical protein
LVLLDRFTLGLWAIFKIYYEKERLADPEEKARSLGLLLELPNFKL